MTSEMYVFETINNQECVIYRGVYDTGGSFVFTENPYFTMIYTNYDGSSYNNTSTRNGTPITEDDINSMLFFNIKVDLFVQGKDTADLILPLVSIDGDYAYFSNNNLTLKVDANGDVTEFQLTP